MAGDQAQRSEEPTPRRKSKAREEGQIASSRELTSALQFTVAVWMLTHWGDTAAQNLLRSMRGVFAEAFRESITVDGMLSLAGALLLEPLSFLGALAGALLTIGLVMHMSQTGFALTVKKLAPDFKRLNPGQKIKDLPGENLSQTLKAALLLPIAALVFWYVVHSELDRFLTLPKMSLWAGAVTVAESMGGLLMKAAVVLMALGLLDFWRQRRRIHKRLKMTRQEVKQEHKDLEGSPQVKMRLRRMQREIMRRRMMADVAKSTVVVTNPTHYAVALKYEPDRMPAPQVVARGLDFLALRIREVAEENGVPLVENPPLAQALYKSTQIGSEIPEDLYRAVAEILAYIFKLRERM